MHKIAGISAVALGVISALALTLGANPADADEGYVKGYVTTRTGKILRGGAGQCWRSGGWKPRYAVEECDPEIYAKFHPKPAEPKPEIAVVEPRMVIITVKETVAAEALFDFNRAELAPRGQAALDRLSEDLTKFENVRRVRVVGYADRLGSKTYNDALSARRAAAVEDYLRDRAAIQADTFEREAMGSRNPVVGCEGVSGAALIECLAPNRRVEIEITAERTQETMQ